MFFSSVIAIDRSIGKEEGSGGAQEGPPGDRANEMRSIANARRPGAPGHEALCSSLRVCVCVCVSLLVNLYQSYFLGGDARPLDRVDAWKQGAGGSVRLDRAPYDCARSLLSRHTKTL